MRAFVKRARQARMREADRRTRAEQHDLRLVRKQALEIGLLEPVESGRRKAGGDRRGRQHEILAVVRRADAHPAGSESGDDVAAGGGEMEFHGAVGARGRIWPHH